MRIDLYTTSRDLQDLILTEYEEALFEEQTSVDESSPNSKVFCFFNLDYNLIINFLKNHPHLEYELRESQTKKVVQRYSPEWN